MPGIFDMIFGSGGKTKQLPTMSPEQQKLMSQTLQQLMGMGFAGAGAPGYQAGMNYLQDLYSQSPQAYARFQEPYMKQFQQQTVPGLAERFSAVGGRQSSGFNQAMGQAGANLASTLGGQFEQMRSANLGNLLGFSQAPFQQTMSMLGLQPYGYMHQPGSSGLLGGILGGMGGGFGMGAGLGLGNMFSNWLGRSSSPSYLTEGGGLPI